MPVRFTSPGLGGKTEAFLRAGQWQVGFAYRHLSTDKWYVGTKVQESAAPFGQPLFLSINSYDLNVSYGVNDRTSLQLTLPFSYGTHSRIYGENDGNRHKVASGGLGDINLVGTAWLWDPHVPRGANLAFGLGFKTPSGNNRVTDDIILANGSVVRKTVDQSIQLGDGGWGVILQTQAYWTMFHQFYGYLFGAYLMSVQEKTDVPSPIPGVTLGIPDVYSGRVGVAYPLPFWREAGVSVNLGARIDGIPKRDVIGGGDLAFRRPGYTLYLDPGVGVAFGRSLLTVSVPVAVHRDFPRSLADEAYHRVGGGDLAGYLIVADYALRF